MTHSTPFSTEPLDQSGVQALADGVKALIEQEPWSFACACPATKENYVLTPEEVAAPDGFLPVVLHRVGFWMKQAIGVRPPMTYTTDIDALCQARPVGASSTASLSVWLAFIHFSLEDAFNRHCLQIAQESAHKPAAIKAAQDTPPLPLDTWLHQWEQALAGGLVHTQAANIQSPDLS